VSVQYSLGGLTPKTIIRSMRNTVLVLAADEIPDSQ